MKQKVNIFISYAHRNSDLSKKFIEQFYDYIKPSKSFEYIIWYDVEIKPGVKWKDKITEKLNECDCGLLLISPSFLNSDFITKKELPTLLDTKKVVIPVLLHEIDFELYDLKGLEEHQIYRFTDTGFKSPRSYYKLKAKRRSDFIADLFVKLEERLKEYFSML